MTSRQARAERTGRSVRVTRKIRREQERKAKKAAYKAGLHALPAPASPLPELPIEEEFTPEFLVDARAMRERIERRLASTRQSATTPPLPSTKHLAHCVNAGSDEAAIPDEPAPLSVAKTRDGEPKTQTEAFVRQNDTISESGFVSQAAPTPGRTRAEINRANAAHSTGPVTPEGKAASSRNSLKHGLASGTLIIPGENPADFEALLQDLLHDHQPANTTEGLLVQEMAQSYWLTQRALRLQSECFSAEGIDEKRLALFLRYQTTHERAFHKALNVLIRLQKERRRAEHTSARGFVSQHAPATGAERLDEPAQLSKAKTQSAFVPQTVSQHGPPFAHPRRIPHSTPHV